MVAHFFISSHTQGAVHSVAEVQNQSGIPLAIPLLCEAEVGEKKTDF